MSSPEHETETAVDGQRIRLTHKYFNIYLRGRAVPADVVVKSVDNHLLVVQAWQHLTRSTNIVVTSVRYFFKAQTKAKMCCSWE